MLPSSKRHFKLTLKFCYSLCITGKYRNCQKSIGLDHLVIFDAYSHWPMKAVELT